MCLPNSLEKGLTAFISAFFQFLSAALHFTGHFPGNFACSHSLIHQQDRNDRRSISYSSLTFKVKIIITASQHEFPFFLDNKFSTPYIMD
jgi:hypothetical protein